MKEPARRASHTYDRFGDPVGLPVSGDLPSALEPEPMEGRYTRLERVDPAVHSDPLFEALHGGSQTERLWTYMPFGPYRSPDELSETLVRLAAWDDWLGYTIFDEEGRPSGWAAYMRVDRDARSAEVGGIVFSPALQRTRSATEAMYLMAARVFGAGYRRYEWKCDRLNAPSRRAADRLGFTFEGVFRNATVYKGRSRDTAWYSMTAEEWPELRRAFEAWLDPANFDEEGGQRQPLSNLRER